MSILVTVTADDEPMPVHEETRRVFNAGIRASEAVVREAARTAGIIFHGAQPHREGDVYTRVWHGTDGSTLRAKVERAS
jgi:uracil-DNA glycosylase